MRSTRFTFSSQTMAAALLLLGHVSLAAEWQWSIPDGNARAYLWIPPDCQRVRGVLVASNNMIEGPILEHPTMRQTLAKLGFAEVWVVPSLDLKFDFTKGAGEHFDRVMAGLADASGYEELKSAPIVPMGHSAHATFPWNFAAWNPQRTLCVLSVKGDAPQTNLTGYGGKNVDWGDRTIDGIPGLMVMSQQEWNEQRLAPAMAFRQKHPHQAIAVYAEVGNGHFSCSDNLVGQLAQFIDKSAQWRLPKALPASLTDPVPLAPVTAEQGWVIDQWHADAAPSAPPAPFASYTGDRSHGFFCFDKEMADSIEAQYAKQFGKKPQMVGFVHDGTILAGEPCTIDIKPGEDGIGFTLDTAFLDKVGGAGGNPAHWTGLQKGDPLGHATTGDIEIHKTIGPVRHLEGNHWQISLDRSVYTADRRNNDAWVVATHPGDTEYRGIAQQCQLKLSPNKDGADQTIIFPPIADQKAGVASVPLEASASSGLPVHYYVREGPAEIDGDSLVLSAFPPRAKRPLRVTVIAWQWGRSADPKIKTATQVEATFTVGN